MPFQVTNNTITNVCRLIKDRKCNARQQVILIGLDQSSNRAIIYNNLKHYAIMSSTSTQVIPIKVNSLRHLRPSNTCFHHTTDKVMHPKMSYKFTVSYSIYICFFIHLHVRKHQQVLAIQTSVQGTSGQQQFVYHGPLNSLQSKCQLSLKLLCHIGKTFSDCNTVKK